MERRLKEQTRRELIDMRRYTTEAELQWAYCMAFKDFCQVTCDVISDVNSRLQRQFPGSGWTVVDIGEEKLQIIRVTEDQAGGRMLYGPTVLYTFGCRDKEKHRNFYMDNPSVDDTLRTPDADGKAVDVGNDAAALQRVIRNIRFTNYVETRMAAFLDEYYNAEENIYQFCNEMTRRGMEIPKMEIRKGDDDND